MQPETRFKIKVKANLDLIAGSFWIKTQMLSIRGIPDFLGVYKGRFIALELKVGKNKADGLQGWTLKKIADCGGYARVVTPKNLQEVLAEIRALT